MRMNSEERKRRKRRRVGCEEEEKEEGVNRGEKKERWGGSERVLRGV